MQPPSYVELVETSHWRVGLHNIITKIIGSGLFNSLGTGFFFGLKDHFGPLSQPITGRRGMFT